jgi:serine/threonine-protein kinase
MSRPNWVGQTLGGRYKIDAVLGQGGMSAVYRGEDPNLHRTVAIKLIHSHLTGDPEFVRRFEAEAAAVAQLRHPNIIQVYDFNHDDDTYYMVLEYLPGETLQARLRREARAGKGLPAPEALEIAAAVADAVEYAHRRGLIHRDIKPANIMLDDQGRPTLMDFGIAKIMGGAQHTATGAVVGTATYISPEQVLGQRPTERSDIYSLGVTLYEMVAGRPPFEADSAMTLMMKHVNELPPDLRTLSPNTPPDVVAAIDKALAKDPALRYQSAAAMATALRAVADRLRTGQTDLGHARPLDERPTVADKSAPMAMPPIGRQQPLQSRIERAPAPARLEPAPTAGARRGLPMWALVGLPLVAVLCLAVAALGTMAVMASLRPTATPAQTQPAAATEAPTQIAATGVAPTVPLPTDTPPAEATAAPTEPGVPVPAGMVLAPAGTFQMGSSSGAADEQPVHTVTLDAFFIDQFEVTNARYQACVDAGACTAPQRTRSETRSQYFGNPDFVQFPVIQVTWDQAQVFCNFDGGKRLPTEAEWEYAATGGDGRRFPFGNTFDSHLVPVNSADTVVVNSFPLNASPFGAVDMAGNVLEWVADVYDSEFYAEAPEVNPQGPASGSERVLRGGSFGAQDAAVYTTTRRYHKVATQTDVDIGFRCALSAP